MGVCPWGISGHLLEIQWLGRSIGENMLRFSVCISFSSSWIDAFVKAQTAWPQKKHSRTRCCERRGDMHWHRFVRLQDTPVDFPRVHSSCPSSYCPILAVDTACPLCEQQSKIRLFVWSVIPYMRPFCWVNHRRRLILDTPLQSSSSVCRWRESIDEQRNRRIRSFTRRKYSLPADRITLPRAAAAEISFSFCFFSPASDHFKIYCSWSFELGRFPKISPVVVLAGISVRTKFILNSKTGVYDLLDKCVWGVWGAICLDCLAPKFYPDCDDSLTAESQVLVQHE